MKSSDFYSNLEEILESFSGVIGFCAKRLHDGLTLEHNKDEVFPAASVVKIPILLEALHQVQLGILKLETRIPLPALEQVAGSGVLMAFQPGLEPTLEDYLTMMIVVSDNTATNISLDAVGGRDAVNSSLKNWGCSSTTVVGKLMLTDDRKNAEQLAGKRAEVTPFESVMLLEKLYKGEILNPELTKLALEILEKQQYTEILARYLPVGTRTATKSGQIIGVRNDVGIVLTERPFVLALCSKNCTDERYHVDNEAVLALGKISRLVFDVMEIN
jgi:beta-lactamase class A